MGLSRAGQRNKSARATSSCTDSLQVGLVPPILIGLVRLKKVFDLIENFNLIYPRDPFMVNLSGIQPGHRRPFRLSNNK